MLFIRKKKGARVKDAPVDQQYLVFVTNLTCQSVAGLLVNLPSEYKKRWW